MTFDTKLKTRVLCAQDVAAFLGKSVDWVYDHAEDVGGVKRGGSWFFPNEENIYDCLFQGRERVQVRFHGKRQALHQGVVQGETGRKTAEVKRREDVEKELELDATGDMALLDLLNLWLDYLQDRAYSESHYKKTKLAAKRLLDYSARYRIPPSPV